MEMTILLVIQVLLSCAIIGLILIQQGKGATTGAAFGSGASSTVFGARGSASFLTRTTAVLAILFFANSFLLSYLYSHTTAPKSLMEQAASVKAPATDKAKTTGGTAPADSKPPANKADAGAAENDMPPVPTEQQPASGSKDKGGNGSPGNPAPKN